MRILLTSLPFDGLVVCEEVEEERGGGGGGKEGGPGNDGEINLDSTN